MLRPPPFWRMPAILIREWRTPPGRQRVPEPMVMDEEEEVLGFERAASTSASLTVMYHVSARAISSWLPDGGQVVDIGCGPGEFLMYLAERRPDCRVLGLDLSEPMVRQARSRIARARLTDRVAAVQGDATNLPDDLLPARIDVVSCLNLLHQFPDAATLDRFLAQVAQLRERFGCGLWLFDLARARHPRTVPAILGIFGHDMDEVAVRLAVESEAAAWTVSELRDVLGTRGLGDLRTAVSRMPGVLQAHWCPPARPVAPAADRWVAGSLPVWARLQSRLFRGLPARQPGP
jgi:tRNA (cmo5U34)-methyltransferase